MSLTLPICVATPDDCVPPGIYRDMPAHDYHRMNAVPSGLVKVMAKHAPIHVLDWLTTPQSTPSAQMRFGTAVHAAILEPDVYAAAPTISGLKSNAQAQTFARYEREHGPVILAEGWSDSIARIRSNVYALEDAPDWGCGDRELTIVWDETTASGFKIRCKARIDYVCDGWLVDVKTTRSIEPTRFAKDAHELMYHVSIAGHYSRAYEAAGELDPDFWQGGVTDSSILAIENEAPYDAVMLTCTERWTRYGRRVWAQALDRLAYCLAMNDWPGAAAETRELDLPSYAGVDE